MVFDQAASSTTDMESEHRRTAARWQILLTRRSMGRSRACASRVSVGEERGVPHMTRRACRCTTASFLTCPTDPCLRL